MGRYKIGRVSRVALVHQWLKKCCLRFIFSGIDLYVRQGSPNKALRLGRYPDKRRSKPLAQLGIAPILTPILNHLEWRKKHKDGFPQQGGQIINGGFPQ